MIPFAFYTEYVLGALHWQFPLPGQKNLCTFFSHSNSKKSNGFLKNAFIFPLYLVLFKRIKTQGGKNKVSS